jgi:hypothetical protein
MRARRPGRPSLGEGTAAYFFTFAHRFFCAAEILARAAADIVRLPFAAFGAALPFNAEMAASTPDNFLTSVARSAWSKFNRFVI